MAAHHHPGPGKDVAVYTSTGSGVVKTSFIDPAVDRGYRSVGFLPEGHVDLRTVLRGPDQLG
jgi:hypothetical protein